MKENILWVDLSRKILSFDYRNSLTRNKLQHRVVARKTSRGKSYNIARKNRCNSDKFTLFLKACDTDG